MDTETTTYAGRAPSGLRFEITVTVWSDGPVVIRHARGSETVRDGTATRRVRELARSWRLTDLTAVGPDLLGLLGGGRS